MQAVKLLFVLLLVLNVNAAKQIGRHRSAAEEELIFVDTFSIDAEEADSSGSGDVDGSGSTEKPPAETTTTPAPTTALPATTTTVKYPTDTTFTPVVSATMTVDFVVIEGNKQYWNENLTDLNSELYSQAKTIFETNLGKIYAKAAIAYAKLQVNTFTSSSPSSFWRSVRADDVGIQAHYKVTLPTTPVKPDETSLVQNQEANLNKALTDLQAELSAIFGAVGIKIESVAIDVILPKEGLTDEELVAIIICSTLGGLALVILVGYLLFRSTHKKSKPEFDIETKSRRRSSSSSSSSSSGSKKIAGSFEPQAPPPIAYLPPATSTGPQIYNDPSSLYYGVGQTPVSSLPSVRAPPPIEMHVRAGPKGGDDSSSSDSEIEF